MATPRTATLVDGFERLLPEGETVLWTGAPDPATWLRRSWSLRAVWLWVGVIAVAGLVRSGPAAPELVWMGVVGLVGTAFVAAFAFWIARSTRYLITDRRIAMHIGLALPGEANIPFEQLEGASVRRYGDGSGDIAIKPTGPLGVGWFILWPHARPWRFNRPEPLFRALGDVEAPAEVIRRVVMERDGELEKVA